MRNPLIEKLGRKWWILGGERFGLVGPYDNRREAEADLRGMLRFVRRQDEPGFVSVDKGGVER